VLSNELNISYLLLSEKIMILILYEWFLKIFNIIFITAFQIHTVLSNKLNVSCLSLNKKITMLMTFKWFSKICNIILQFAFIFKFFLIHFSILFLNCFCIILITDVNKSTLQYTYNEVCFIVVWLCNINLFISWINSHKLKQLIV